MSKRLTIEEFIKTLKSGGSSGGSVLIVNLSYDDDTITYTADKTWKQIYDAFMSGVSVRFIDNDHPDDPYPKVHTVSYIYTGSNPYQYSIETTSGRYHLNAHSEDEYPTYYAGD